MRKMKLNKNMHKLSSRMFLFSMLQRDVFQNFKSVSIFFNYSSSYGAQHIFFLIWSNLSLQVCKNFYDWITRS